MPFPEPVAYKISERLDRIAGALENRNVLERRKIEALELRNRVELFSAWTAYRAAGGANTSESMANGAIKLENLLKP
jgi:hypothetical protein